MASLSVNSVTSVANLLVAASGRAGHSVFNPIVLVTPSLALRASGRSNLELCAQVLRLRNEVEGLAQSALAEPVAPNFLPTCNG